MPVRRGTSLSLRGRRKPIRLVISASESNGSGTGNNLNELPSGVYPTTASTRTLIHDVRNINGNGAGWTGLIPGHMEQQPGNAFGAGVVSTATDNTSATFTNTVGFWGRADQIIRARRPTDMYAFLPSVQGGGRLTDSSSRGRAANYDPQYNDGAFNVLRNLVRSGVADLERLGYEIVERIFIFDFGGNDAIHGDTSSSTWLNPARTFIGALYRDGIIGPNDRIIFNTLGTLLTGAGGIPAAGRTAQNANLAALVADDPTHRSLLPSDDETPMTWYWNGSAFGTDPIHLSAGGHWVKGEKIGFGIIQEWFPELENVNGGAVTVLHSQNFGDYRNVVNSQTINSGALQTLMDWAGLSTPTQATPGNQPAIGSRALPNGLLARFATGNGTSSVLVSTVPTAFNRSKRVISGVIKGAARANDIPFCEAGGATNTPLVTPFWNNNGPATFTSKNNAGTVVGPTSLGSNLFDGNWNQFLFEDDGTNARLDKNGVAGTPITSGIGTITVTTQSLFAQRYNNNASTINFSTCSWQRKHEWSDVLPAALKDKLANFYRFWEGSL